MITAFIKKYDGKYMEDTGAYVSKEFSNFQNAMRYEVKRLVEEIGADMVSFNKGHYDMNWFVEKNGRYIYCYYSNIARRSVANLTSCNTCLVRTVTSSKDYYGGKNHFCSFDNLKEEMNKFLN